MVDVRPEPFFPFNNGALTRSGTNQHDDSQTYCDALFSFCLRLITSYQLTTITLKCVWITSGEDGKGGGNGSYTANPSWGLWLSERFSDSPGV